MAAILDVDDALLIKTRLAGLIVPGERRFCKDEVEFCENLEIGQQFVLIRDQLIA